MTHTAMATTMDQQIRNQLSLMAWVMAGLCGWVMFLSAHSISVTCTASELIHPDYSSNQSSAHK